MSGWIIAFKLPARLGPVERTQFQQRFWGQTTSSWGGRYRYRRHGIMEAIPHRKILRGVLLIPLSEGPRVRSFLEQEIGEFFMRRVQLENEDERAFAHPHPPTEP